MRTSEAKNKTYAHFKLQKYKDMDKTILEEELYFMTRNSLSSYIGCSPQGITDFLNGKCGQTPKKYNLLSYILIDKIRSKIKDLEGVEIHY